MESLHASHQGIETTLRRARETMYWPNMNAEIKDYVKKCDLCCSIGPKQSKETLICHKVPDRPWGKIATDLFEFDGKEYLVTVDYFSIFFEIDRLYCTQAVSVIRKLKAHLARYGIPEELISDQGPQFTSGKFKNFCASYGMKHTMTSPHYHQANGMADTAVKQAKRVLKVAKMSGRAPHLALLDLRNTPQEGFSSSSAQRLMSRRTKTVLPISKGLLKPAVTENTKQQRRARQERQKKFYNRGARDLPALAAVKVGDREWKKATVLREAGIRSYEVETENDRTLILNRRHLKEAKSRSANGDDFQQIQELPKTPEVAKRGSSRFDGETDRIPELTPDPDRGAQSSTDSGMLSGE
ncbi:Retrovirus-related Pol poly from transposon [Paramuricea clavata]|uniref:Retrovirus-related Pol poly from transposon n=1 Tax=Paramuricea clavata TaxID=317549 RepID=A0A6S7FMT9_PARCT|nr:Retrovirus-related Pol poly from transposon [Paramuricea clavata]